MDRVVAAVTLVRLAPARWPYDLGNARPPGRQEVLRRLVSGVAFVGVDQVERTIRTVPANRDDWHAIAKDGWEQIGIAGRTSADKEKPLDAPFEERPPRDRGLPR
jgi:hypothetical protein